MAAILLVADDQWVVNDVSAAVTSPGARLDTVPDADDAVTRLIDREYDLVVVDMQVGNMGGMAITRRLRDAMRMEGVELRPVVMLLDRSADAFLARRAGADAQVVKPFTAQEFRSATASLGSPVA